MPAADGRPEAARRMHLQALGGDVGAWEKGGWMLLRTMTFLTGWA